MKYANKNIRNLNSRFAESYVERKEYQARKEEMYKEIIPDSKERKLINTLIRQELIEGAAREELLIILKNKFPNSKLSVYFETWIEHWANKLNISHESYDDNER